MSISPAPQLVLKVSKHCNLRCGYCYEFLHLADETRMSLPMIEAMFENVRRSIEELGLEQINFVWHGGEPFLLPIGFYEQVAEIQERLFGTDVRYLNTVQTNLTVLTDRHVAFLKGGFFATIGVSFDVYGDQRVDARGRSRTDTVLANLQKLIDHGIRFAAIAVLARDTLASVREIYRFFDDLGINHRMLAYYRSAGSEQAERHGLGHDELVRAYEDLFHQWLASETATRVTPIADFVRYAVRYLTRDARHRFDRSTGERVFIIDVNGDLYSDVEPYEADFCYGNLSSSPLSRIVTSEAARRSRALSEERTRRFCQSCPYFGCCPGAFVSNATLERRKLLEADGCPVRAVLDHIVGVFERTGLEDFISRTHGAGAMPDGLPC